MNSLLLKRSVAAVCIAACLSGCSRSLPMASEPREKESYSLAQMMLVVANERNRYEEIYTDQIWTVKVDDEGTTFQGYLLDEIKSFLAELRTINLMAAEQEIVLTEQEKESLRQLARDYYGKLTAGDKAYIGAEEEDIYTMYAEYHLANKVIAELTKDINLEISDSEAKVISVMEIVTDDADSAQEAYAKLQEEGADFAAVARTYSQGETLTRKIGRGDHDDSYEEQAYSLATDEVSGVFQAGEQYYILKCVSDYEADDTLARKQTLSLQRRSQAFRQIYSQFSGEHHVELADELFIGLVFSPQDNTSTSEFFKMYQDYMTK